MATAAHAHSTHTSAPLGWGALDGPTGRLPVTASAPQVTAWARSTACPGLLSHSWHRRAHMEPALMWQHEKAGPRARAQSEACARVPAAEQVSRPASFGGAGRGRHALGRIGPPISAGQAGPPPPAVASALTEVSGDSHLPGSGTGDSPAVQCEGFPGSLTVTLPAPRAPASGLSICGVRPLIPSLRGVL